MDRVCRMSERVSLNTSRNRLVVSPIVGPTRFYNVSPNSDINIAVNVGFTLEPNWLWRDKINGNLLGLCRQTSVQSFHEESCAKELMRDLQEVSVKDRSPEENVCTAPHLRNLDSQYSVVSTHQAEGENCDVTDLECQSSGEMLLLYVDTQHDQIQTCNLGLSSSVVHGLDVLQVSVSPDRSCVALVVSYFTNAWRSCSNYVCCTLLYDMRSGVPLECWQSRSSPQPTMCFDPRYACSRLIKVNSDVSTQSSVDLGEDDYQTNAPLITNYDIHRRCIVNQRPIQWWTNATEYEGEASMHLLTSRDGSTCVVQVSESVFHAGSAFRTSFLMLDTDTLSLLRHVHCTSLQRPCHVSCHASHHAVVSASDQHLQLYSDHPRRHLIETQALSVPERARTLTAICRSAVLVGLLAAAEEECCVVESAIDKLPLPISLKRFLKFTYEYS